MLLLLISDLSTVISWSFCSQFFNRKDERHSFFPCGLSTLPALTSHQGCWLVPSFSVNLCSPCFALLLAKTQTWYFHSRAWIASLTFWVEEGSLLKRIWEHFVQRAGFIIQHYPEHARIVSKYAILKTCQIPVLWRTGIYSSEDCESWVHNYSFLTAEVTNVWKLGSLLLRCQLVAKLLGKSHIPFEYLD